MNLLHIYIYKFIISHTYHIQYNAKLQYRGYMFRPSMVIFYFWNYCSDMTTHCCVLAKWTLPLLCVCFSEVRSFVPPPRPPVPPVQCSVSKCSENLCESRGRHSPQTSPPSRYKLERNYYYRPSPISLSPPPLQLLHFLPHTPRVSCCRVFWRFRTVTKDQTVKSLFPTSAVRVLRQHNPETIPAKITLTWWNYRLHGGNFPTTQLWPSYRIIMKCW